MPPKPTKGKDKEKFATEEDRQSARSSVSLLIEQVAAKPSLRTDPVLQALVHKLCELMIKDFGTDQSYKTVGVAMNALRSAGVFDTPTAAPNASDGARPEPKSKARSTKADTPQKATEKGQRLRGLDRSIDWLLEFGYLTEKDVEAFRALRKDPDRLIEFVKEGGETLKRRVKDTGDWDLIFALDAKMYDRWMALADSAAADFDDAKGAFEPESFAALVERALETDSDGNWTDADSQGLRSVLKGPPLDQLMAAIKKGTYTPLQMLEAARGTVLKQRWFKFGKSPTLSRVD